MDTLNKILAEIEYILNQRVNHLLKKNDIFTKKICSITLVAD